MARPRNDNHLAVIEAVLRGENQSGWPDKTIILTHAREMQRVINELNERIKHAHSQLELFTRSRHAADQTETG